MTSQIETACAKHYLFAGLDLEGFPRVVRRLGHLHVTGGVIREADDAAVVLRSPSAVAQLELLDPEDFLAQPSRQPIGRGAADPSEPEDDHAVVAHSSCSPI